MVKELNSMSKKELKQFQQAVKVIKKVFSLSDDDLDAFFALVKGAKDMTKAVSGLDVRMAEIESAMSNKNNEDNRSSIQKMNEWMNKKPVGLDYGN